MRPILFCVCFLGNAAAIAGDDPYGPITDVRLIKAEDREDAKSVPPPKDAVVLFDGKSLDNWVKRDGKSEPSWKVLPGGIMQVSGGDIITKEKFAAKFKLHVEFRVPYEPKKSGQGRGNSGVYVQGRYEVQVLDSYLVTGGKLHKSGMGDCGGIYGIAPPTVNACKAPTVWQTYDIEFTAPVCEGGKKKEPAVMTVFHNGVKIHDNVTIKLDNTTSGAGGDVCTPGPIMLQDHGNPVQYRNIWLAPMK